MTLPNLPEVPPNPSTQQLAQVVGALVQELTYLLSGFLSSNNAREFGGWQIGTTELQSKAKTVGMSTEVTGSDDIRFWAGDLKDASPKFKVTEAGVTSLVSAIISSVASGERVVIDSTGIHCYDSSNVERLTIGTTVAKGVKAITGRDTSGVEQSVITYDTTTVDGASRTGQFITAHGAYFLLGSDGSVRMQDSSLSRGLRVAGTRPELNDGGGWSTIAKVSEVNAKQNAFTGVNGTVYVASVSGGPTTTAITFTNGVRTS